ncbi:Aminotransferase class-V family protein [Candida albicans]|uniref:cysteine desulfurase n=1 Tax=Candida albicans TaxID=5476 RepID=A0A8H6BXD9_CANAX|nr:Aminotransferase class-V family protein [Candida albicans]
MYKSIFKTTGRLGKTVSSRNFVTTLPKPLATSSSPATNAPNKTSNPKTGELHVSTPVDTAKISIEPPEGSSISLKSASRDASLFGTRPIYLDVQATTPVDPRVLDKMLEFYTGLYGNPHSSTHAYGWETDKEVEKARTYIADVINADPKEIIFTSGATETNNMAIKGVPRFYKKTKKHIITTQTEHKCVLDSARHMQDEGFEVTYLPVKIGKICRENKVFFHTDAAQAYGKIPIDVNEMNIDLLSISSHKIYGPKGIGACYVRRRPRVRLDPIITGGGQERGLRSGTLAPPLVAGFGEAARLMKQESSFDKRHIEKLSSKLKNGLLSIPSTQFNGCNDAKSQYPGCVNVSFAYIEGESLLMALKDIALSSGSACTSASLEPSYVLHALGADDALAHSSIRFGIGRFTTEAEVDYVIQAINERVDFLRKMSPLWEMVQEGIDLNTIEWSGH